MGEANPAIRVRVAAVIHNEAGDVLVVRQNNKPFWVLPGGTLEFGETLPTCLARELMEELNLNIAVGKLVSVSEFVTDKRHVVDTVFNATITGGQLTMTTDENLNEVAWVAVEKLATLPLMPAEVADRMMRRNAVNGGQYVVARQ